MKLWADIKLGLASIVYDTSVDYRFPERLNGASFEEIQEYALDYIGRMPNTLVLIADKPYGKGYIYVIDKDKEDAISEGFFAYSGDLRLTLRAAAEYLSPDKKARAVRPYVFVGEDGKYNQIPWKKILRMTREDRDDTKYEDGKTEQDLLSEGYFEQFKEETAE